MAKFSQALGDKIAKVQNQHTAHRAKVDIRDRVLSAVGDQANVFDAFGGAGEMYHDVWSRAAGYAACDERWFRDQRLAWVADNRRVLRTIDLSAYNIFDLDAWGSPWEQVLIIADRRRVAPGETIGFVLTEGSGLKMKQGALPKALGAAAGLDMRVAGTARLADDIINRAINGVAKRMNCEIVQRYQAKGKTGARMLYIGLVLRGRDQSAAEAAGSSSGDASGDPMGGIP